MNGKGRQNRDKQTEVLHSTSGSCLRRRADFLQHPAKARKTRNNGRPSDERHNL